jgi:Holliday junction resolvasome RuvABC endonuclease subunit
MKRYGITWEPTLDLTILKTPQITKLSKEHAEQIFGIQNFLTAIPDNALRSYQVHLIQWADTVLPNDGIGADPGLKLGVAYTVDRDHAFTFRTYIDRSSLSVSEMLDVFYNVPLLVEGFTPFATPVVVEGAAYNAKYGQPLLGEIRGALILGFGRGGYRFTSEVQPLSIRKRVFGAGNVQPMDFWKAAGYIKADKDAADALSMAICAGM